MTGQAVALPGFALPSSRTPFDTDGGDCLGRLGRENSVLGNAECVECGGRAPGRLEAALEFNKGRVCP